MRMPKDEQARLMSLMRHNLLDTAPEQDFDDVVILATEICETPYGGITLVDATRQWFKAKVGLNIAGSERSLAFCGHTILDSKPLVIPDALSDERFRTNRLVTAGPKIRFYAGIPLSSVELFHIGSLWVGDCVPRTLTERQSAALGR